MLKGISSFLQSVTRLELKSFLTKHVTFLACTKLVKLPFSLRLKADVGSVSAEMLRLVIGGTESSCNVFVFHKSC